MTTPLIVLMTATTGVTAAIVHYHIQKKLKSYELEDFIAYNFDLEEIKARIDERQITKEKGKPPIHVLRILSKYVGIDEKTYDEFIGDDSNIVTVHVATMDIYLAKKTIFGPDFTRCEKVSFRRISFPWDGKVFPYTIFDVEKEIPNIYEHIQNERRKNEERNLKPSLFDALSRNAVIYRKTV